MSKTANTFQGIRPDGQPATFQFGVGSWYSYTCPDCGESNGGGIENDYHPVVQDQYSPVNRPCIWCGKGPMVVVQETGVDTVPSSDIIQRITPPT